MCGISGFCDFLKESNTTILKSMIDVLHHRGPDDSGCSFLENKYAFVGLGHRRLSILDLSKNGHQPMQFNELEIVFNGEVYNFKDIRIELEQYGYSFESQSDTEVILKAYHKWGIKSVDKFNGMFSIAIFDKKQETIVLIRDRSGVKPLYWYFNDGLFMFSSELKSFHKNTNFRKEINIDSLATFLQIGYIPQPYSIFKSVRKLQAGHYLILDLKTKKIEEKKYWDIIKFYNKPKFDLSENEAIEEMEKLLYSSFTYRMISDVPVGVFLSGGYDSSAVTAILQKDSIKKIKTFTIGFNETKYNEANYAKKVAEYLGTDHTEYYCTENEALGVVPSLVEIFDEPFGDSSAIPTVLVSKLAKESVKVSLSADGGDEIFAGYNKYQSQINMKSKIFSLCKKFLDKRTLFNVTNNLLNIGKCQDGSLETILSSYIFEDNIELQKLLPYYISPIRLESIISNYKYKRIDTSFDEINQVNNDSLSKMLAIDFKTYLPDDVLVKVDRSTMSVGLEGREPLLDHRLAEFVAQLPSQYKIHNTEKKLLLKNIVHKYLPKEMMERPKKGFSVPMDIWLRNDLKDYVEKYLGNYDNDYLNSEELKKMKKLFYERKVNHRIIWNLVIFQMWHERWMS